MGAMLGATFGHTVNEWFPAIEPARTHFNAFPIVNGVGELVGMVSVADLDRALAEAPKDEMTVADVIDTSSNVLVVYPDESMGTALRRLGIRDVRRLPVLDGEGSRRLIGVVRRNDIVRAYLQTRLPLGRRCATSSFPKIPS